MVSRDPLQEIEKSNEDITTQLSEIQDEKLSNADVTLGTEYAEFMAMHGHSRLEHTELQDMERRSVAIWNESKAKFKVIRTVWIESSDKARDMSRRLMF